jgi:LPXTG-motif cell wall-anchored protein
VAGATTLALGFSGAFFIAAPASAEPGSSVAEARYLSGELLNRSLDDVVALAGERAEAGPGTEEVVTESGNLELSVLGDLLELQVADGITIPLSVADAGVVSQYAQASQSGTATAGAGTLTDGGIIDVDPTTPPTDALTFDLSNLLGEDLTAAVASMNLTAEGISATATKTGTETGEGDYTVADLTATLEVPALAALSDSLLASGDGVETSVLGALGSDGTLATQLTSSLAALGVVSVDADVAVDLNPALEEVLTTNQLLGADGPVTIDLLTGTLTVDVAALLAADNIDLNALSPDQDILTSELVTLITAEVDSLVNGLLDEAQAAVTATLDSTELTLNVLVGDEETPVLTLATAGTLGAIARGEVPTTVTLGDGVEFDGGILTALVGTTVTEVLNSDLSTADVVEPLQAIYPALDQALTSLVRLQGNVQESTVDTFTQTALRLTLLTYTDEAGGPLVLNLASAAVGPNALPTEDGPETVLPDVLSITPVSGPEAGGTDVTIIGSGFIGTEQVLFEGTPATAVEVVSATEITATTPAGVGVADVTVVKPVGNSTLEDAFTYVAAPEVPATVVSVTPDEGPETGGTAVVIDGTGFTDATEVTFAGTPGTSFEVISDTRIEVVTPAGIGVVDVVVVIPSGDATASEAFTYLPVAEVPGTIVNVTPATGPEAGGTEVTIDGSGFTAATEVTFNGVPGISFEVVDDSTITVTTPAGTGLVDVIVVLPTGDVIAPDAFTYVADEEPITPPVVTEITPAEGPVAGGTVVTIDGEGFTGVTDVSFGGISGTGITVVNDNKLTVVTPPGTAGLVEVVVERGDGSAAVVRGGFEYVAGPVDGGNNGGVDNGNVTPPPANNGNNGNTGGVYYENCQAAQDAGVGPIAKDKPGYRPALDSNGDGIACESNVAGKTSQQLAQTGGAPLVGIGIAGVLLLLAGGGLVLHHRRKGATA